MENEELNYQEDYLKLKEAFENIKTENEKILSEITNYKNEIDKLKEINQKLFLQVSRPLSEEKDKTPADMREEAEQKIINDFKIRERK